MARRIVQYDHLILFDFMPIPPYQHVSCMAIGSCGLDEEARSSLKLTRAFRLKQRRLKIYEEPHTYIIVAKTDSDCDHYDRSRAVTVLNDFVYEKLKEGVRLDVLAELIVDNFDSRLIKLVPFLPKEEQVPQRKVTSARRRPMFSSDNDDALFAGTRVTAVARTIPQPTPNEEKAVEVDAHVKGSLPSGARVVADHNDPEVKMSRGLTPIFVQPPRKDSETAADDTGGQGQGDSGMNRRVQTVN